MNRRTRGVRGDASGFFCKLGITFYDKKFMDTGSLPPQLAFDSRRSFFRASSFVYPDRKKERKTNTGVAIHGAVRRGYAGKGKTMRVNSGTLGKYT